MVLNFGVLICIMFRMNLVSLWIWCDVVGNNKSVVRKLWSCVAISRVCNEIFFAGKEVENSVLYLDHEKHTTAVFTSGTILASTVRTVKVS